KTLDEWYHQKQDEQGNHTWENVHSRVLPFSPESVVRAIWECLSRGIQTPSGGELKVGKTSGDTVEILLRDTFPELGQVAHRSSSSSAPVRLSVRIMLKKFVKASRIVLVRSSVIDIEAEKCRRVRLHGKGWSVLQCLGVQGRSSKDQLASCFAQTCMRVVPVARPEDDGTLNGGEASFSTVPLEFIANYRQTRDFVQQLVENQIVDEC
uniref:Uncharacterized protein n=1 Tax=Globisporangium ultimum (strain ATCC 200006 / CBS 805.95 / DAOM BR144) TaxID=431595 RepID=K3W909_GLOUD